MIKKIVQYHLIPLLIASCSVFLFYFFTPIVSHNTKAKIQIHNELVPNGLFPNFDNGLISELALMSSLNTPHQVTLFGSSELNSISNIFPYTFLKDSLQLNCLAFGHAHHQNLSILCELMAGRPFLKHSKITILLSPSWFEGEGTNPEAFLEFVRPNFLRRIIHDSLIDDKYKLHIGQYIAEHSSYFDGITKELDNLKNFYLSKNGNYVNRIMAKAKIHIQSVHSNSYCISKVNYIPAPHTNSERKKWKWDTDSMLNKEQSKFLQNVKNNLFVDQEYYETYLLEDDGSQKKGSVANINYLNSPELKDFNMLLDFLKENEVNASFVILPLNPYYYENIGLQKPLVKQLANSIISANYPLLDLSCFDKNDYKKGILRDIMHPGEYGWILINEFISKTFP